MYSLPSSTQCTSFSVNVQGSVIKKYLSLITSHAIVAGHKTYQDERKRLNLL